MASESCLKKASLLSLFLLLPYFLFSQSIVDQGNPVQAEMPKNIIKIAPFGFIHGQTPFTVESRLSYERVIGRNSSIAGSYSHIGSNPIFGFIGTVAFSATLTTALTLYGKPGKAGIVWSQTEIETNGYRYQFQFKQYISRNALAPEGFYLSPHYSYAEADYKVTMHDLDVNLSLEAKNQNYNLLFGYQNVLGKHLVVDLFTGLGYKSKRTKVFDANGAYLGEMKKGFPLKISSGFNLGWAF